jgi:hypothetical protein
MKNFDFYEFAGLLAPGAVLLVGLSALYPQIGLMVQGKDVTVGELGLFVIMAYVVGHLVQSAGSVVEPLYEKLTGGRPSVRVQTGHCDFLSPQQVEAVKAQLSDKLGLPASLDITKLEKRAWLGIVSQIYAAVQAAGRSGRVDIFNGNYSLLRGIAAALLIILALVLRQRGFTSPDVLVGLLLAIAAAVYRMYRFSVLYAREVFVQFLLLPPVNTNPQAPPSSSSM